MLWATEEIDDDELERQAEYGVASCLAGALTEGPHRDQISARLGELETAIAPPSPASRAADD